jgi:hypothetical protein
VQSEQCSRSDHDINVIMDATMLSPFLAHLAIPYIDFLKTELTKNFRLIVD